ncbi:hypothetical protein HEP84_51855 [Streptomyces sp. RLB1-33]|nr:hypothetical protein [Streptomyces sp. RLB1-33]QIY76159.1 hypothetical protein HEP84_51855 [Streptomyces sp. RLB1-33]
MNLPETLGFADRTAATGGRTLLPLGLRVRARLSRITRDGLEDRGANTVAFPTLQNRVMWVQHTAYEFVVPTGINRRASFAARGSVLLA